MVNLPKELSLGIQHILFRRGMGHVATALLRGRVFNYGEVAHAVQDLFQGQSLTSGFGKTRVVYVGSDDRLTELLTQAVEWQRALVSVGSIRRDWGGRRTVVAWATRHGGRAWRSHTGVWNLLERCHQARDLTFNAEQAVVQAIDVVTSETLINLCTDTEGRHLVQQLDMVHAFTGYLVIAFCAVSGAVATFRTFPVTATLAVPAMGARDILGGQMTLHRDAVSVHGRWAQQVGWPFLPLSVTEPSEFLAS
ncbi:MAG: hypothetical protein Q9219_007250 [cf. Caloplaca sp. 3 TL-2023]